MYYVSTRDKGKKTYSFSEVLLCGLADDGGLFVPEVYPHISLETLKHFKTLPYHELAFEIMKLFIGNSIPEQDLKSILTKTYSTSHFKSEDITPVTSVYKNIYLQDLSLGPSLAFKDLAMQFLGNVIEYELVKQNKSLTILGASSGDTVSAAEEAMKSKDRINVVMLTPKVGMSPFQKAQAGAILDKNIFNISIEGHFDICQDLVKEVNKDLAFKNQYSIGAVNSINWGRICAQIVYYIKGYTATVANIGEPLDVVVPSGNFGNILAGYIAKQMGVPLRNLVIATNENKVLDTLFKTGIYKQEDVKTTSSPSMDISKASNFERLLFDCVNHDAGTCAKLMSQFEKNKEIDISHLIELLIQNHGFKSQSSNHQQRIDTIKRVYEAANLIIDPHTAAGIYVAESFESDIPILCMETAKPTKFESTVEEALGKVPERDNDFKDLESKEQRFYDVNANAESLKTFIKEHITL
jgi:threonine synthase